MRPKVKYVWSRLRYVLPHVLRGRATPGFCPVCERRTVFCREGPWAREYFKCARCFSNPRWRALIYVLDKFFPEWRQFGIHESSPGGAASDKLARECKNCVQTHWYPDVAPGQVKDGYRCEDLERQTFADGSFDLVITQDVFEHVLDPKQGFAEVARTLKPGGCHVFTIPWDYRKPTLIRARREPDGTIRHLREPDYHGNPIDPKGSLVVTDWGADVCDFIYRTSGLITTVVDIHDRYRGIEAQFCEVFINRKPGPDRATPAL